MIESFYARITGIDIEWEKIVEERAKLCAQYILDCTLTTEAGRLQADSFFVLCHYLATAAQRADPNSKTCCKDIASAAIYDVMTTATQ